MLVLKPHQQLVISMFLQMTHEEGLRHVGGGVGRHDVGQQQAEGADQSGHGHDQEEDLGDQHGRQLAVAVEVVGHDPDDDRPEKLSSHENKTKS